MNLIDQIESEQLRNDIPEFSAGDTIIVQVKVREGDRERLQAFEGVVIAKKNRGIGSAFTVRKMSHGEGVERVFQTHSKMIDSVEVKHLDEHKTVFRELCIFKIKLSSANDSMEVNKLANAYGGNVHDVKKDSIMVELTSTPEQIQAFEELVKPFGIIDIARTGVTALQRSGD